MTSFPCVCISLLIPCSHPRYDLNSDGLLSKSELLEALTSSGYEEEEVDRLFESHAHGKADLSVEDFLQLMSSNYL